MIAPLFFNQSLFFPKKCVAKYDWGNEVSPEHVLIRNKFGLKIVEEVLVRFQTLTLRKWKG